MTGRPGGGVRCARPAGPLITAAAALVCVAALAGCSGSAQHSADPTDRLVRHDAANDRYGPLPSFLPKNTVRNDSTLTGTPSDPAVTSEGDLVRARVGRADVLAQVSGPVVPGEGLPEPPGATTCTWRVTMTATGAPLRLAAGDFNALDHLGTIYRVNAVPGQRRIPAVVRPGQHVSFELRAVMPTGEGLMRWSPDRRTILAEWDFTVEND